MKISKFNESFSKPQLKYPVDKCLDFTKFQLLLEKKGIDITELSIPYYSKIGNFFNFFNSMDPIFPELSSWKKYSDTESEFYKNLGIPYTPYRYNEYQALYELPIKYDSHRDYANWVEKRNNFFNNMKKMKEMSGKKWTEEDEKEYNNHVDFGPQNNDWYNIVLDELYKLYPQYYKNGKIRVWYDEDTFDGKGIWDYPLEKAYFLSDLEKWIEDTFNIDITGFYEWILDCQYIERRYWERIWIYDFENDESFRKIKPSENIIQINEILRQMFKKVSIPIYIDYYKNYSEKNLSNQ